MRDRRHWLMKSEPDAFSLEDLKSRPNGTEPWDGIRNYQARNLMRDEIEVGDGVLFYHSRVAEPGVVGLAEIARTAYPDHTAWDPKSDYFDPKSNPDNPRWLMVDVRYIETFANNVTLAAIKEHPELSKMMVARRGMRLSIQPVEPEHFEIVCALGRANT